MVWNTLLDLIHMEAISITANKTKGGLDPNK